MKALGARCWSATAAPRLASVTVLRLDNPMEPLGLLLVVPGLIIRIAPDIRKADPRDRRCLMDASSSKVPRDPIAVPSPVEKQ
jgi:hypothetical protein